MSGWDDIVITRDPSSGWGSVISSWATVVPGQWGVLDPGDAWYEQDRAVRKAVGEASERDAAQALALMKADDDLRWSIYVQRKQAKRASGGSNFFDDPVNLALTGVAVATNVAPILPVLAPVISPVLSSVVPQGIPVVGIAGVGMGDSPWAKGLTQVFSPFASIVEAWQAPDVERAKGKAAADMASLQEAEERRAYAEQERDRQRAFLLADALGQFQAARERLAHAYAPVPNLESRLRVAYASEPGISQDYAASFQRNKATADAILALGATTSLPSDPDMALALAARADSQRDAMAAAVAAMQDAVNEAEANAEAFRQARIDAERVRAAAAIEAKRAEGQTMLQRLLEVLR